MNSKKIIILGSTGSIGRQSVEVAALNSIGVEAIAAHTSVDAIERQARECSVKYAAMTDERAAEELASIARAERCAVRRNPDAKKKYFAN